MKFYIEGCFSYIYDDKLNFEIFYGRAKKSLICISLEQADYFRNIFINADRVNYLDFI